LLGRNIVILDLAARQYRIFKQATDLLDRPDLRITDYLTKVEAVEFPTTSKKTAFGLFYPPCNPDYIGAADERPPLLVKCTEDIQPRRPGDQCSAHGGRP
jgi:hypothetical protein